jgi:hypothetical protein
LAGAKLAKPTIPFRTKIEYSTLIGREREGKFFLAAKKSIKGGPNFRIPIVDICFHVERLCLKLFFALSSFLKMATFQELQQAINREEWKEDSGLCNQIWEFYLQLIESGETAPDGFGSDDFWDAVNRDFFMDTAEPLKPSQPLKPLVDYPEPSQPLKPLVGTVHETLREIKYLVVVI